MLNTPQWRIYYDTFQSDHKIEESKYILCQKRKVIRKLFSALNITIHMWSYLLYEFLIKSRDMKFQVKLGPYSFWQNWEMFENILILILSHWYQGSIFQKIIKSERWNRRYPFWNSYFHKNIPLIFHGS